ncbi:DUF898 family protein [Desulfatitalea tepidiphila]|uniref:DUF898 family protein n=1 Tax=Desulfatitalea tepidiphila TaxID=1185843 RepID=UPI0006B407BB|nr:DUF898 family protein [Desulfatitalea tepidiphila]
MSWYYKDGGQEIGPISKAELAALIKSGRVGGQTMVRNITMDAWRPLAQMIRPAASGSADPSPPAPPAPPTAPDASRSVPMPDIPSVKSQEPFQFKGSGGEYFKIWIVNVLLSFVTLGIYSAWAKVRRKQYFYGNTRLVGATFRYLAEPTKILKGRIVVFLGFAIYMVVNQIFPPAGFAFGLVFLFILPWLVVRSLAFNARNSAWRNIRFNFNGTYGGAAKAFVLFPLLSILTLGILGPYAHYRQKKFIVENSTYGTTAFAFHATAGDYYRIVYMFMIPVIAAIAVVTAVTMLVPSLSAPVALLVMVVMYLYAFAYFTVRSSNLLYNSGALRQHRFKATMKIKAFAMILLTNTLAIVCTLGLFHPFAQVRAYRYKIDHLALLPAGDLSQFVAAELKQTSALGDELSDFMDFDFGL